MNKLIAKLLLGVLFVLGAVGANAQTTLISPTGAGGFELAVPTGTGITDYTANGWTLVQGANNRMWIGTTAVPSAGTYSSFSGVSAASFTGEAFANVNHFYRDITFPAGETGITLSFKHKIVNPDVGGASDFDNLKVFLVSTSINPVAATALSAGSQIGTKYESATTYALGTVSISIPASAAGTTQRLVFSWKTDGASPHAAVSIDEISLISQAPVTYTWNAAGGGVYGTSTNWTPTRTTPATSDKLVFDGVITAGPLAITNVPTETIGQFYLSNSAAVSLATVTSTKTLTLNNELNIGAGSSLTFTGTSTVGLNMTMGSGATATMAGTMTLNTTASAAWTVTSLASSTISGTVNNGGTITGGSTTNLSFTGTAIYNHTQNGGTIPTATYAAGSNVNVTGITTTVVTPPSTIGGNFTWNCTGQTGTLLTMGSNLTSIGGTCNILNTGTGSFLFGTTTPPTVTGLFTISGGTLIASGGTFTLNGGMTVSGGTISGTSATIFNVNGNFAQSGTGTITSSTATASIITLSVTGTFNQSAGTISQTGASPGSISINFTGSTVNAVTLSGTNTGIINYRVNNGNGNGINLTGSLNINTGATLTSSINTNPITGGTLTYTGTTTLTYNSSTSAQTPTSVEWPAAGGPTNITINNTSTAGSLNRVSLHAARTITGILTMTSGVLLLGANDLTISSTGSVSGTASNTNFIATNGIGQLIQTYSATGSKSFPMGDVTGTDEASAVTLNYTALTGTSVVGLKVTDAQHPSDASVTNYLSRYFTFTQSGATAGTYTLTLGYQSGDVVGSAAATRLNRWNGSAWAQVSSAVPTTTSVTATGLDFTNLNATSEYTLRAGISNTYTWNVVSGSWASAASWNPSRTTPDPLDILQFNNIAVGASQTAANVPTETITRLIVGNGVTANLQSTVTSTLTIQSDGTAANELSVDASSSLISNGIAAALTITYSSTGSTGTIAGTMEATSAAGSTTNNTFNFTGGTTSVTTVTGTLAAGQSGGTGVPVITGTAATLLISGIYNHKFTTSAGTIPTATWQTNSTCLISGYVAGGPPSGFTQTFFNVNWNCPNQTGNLNCTGSIPNVNGTFTMTTTNTGSLRLSGTTTYTATWANYAQIGGALDLSNGASSASQAINITGTFNQTGGTFLCSGTGTTNPVLNFNGLSAQSVNFFNAAPTGPITYRITNPAGINLTGSGTLTTNFNINATGGVRVSTAAAAPITTTLTLAYNVTGTTLTYDPTANVTATANEFPASGGPSNLTVAVGAGNVLTLPFSRSLSPTGVSGILTMTSGDISIGSNTFTLGTSAAFPGTLTYTAGLIRVTSGSFTRWFPTAGLPIALGGTGIGFYPLAFGTNNRAVNIYFSSVTALSVGGTITASHADVAGVTGVNFFDGAAQIDKITNTSWSFAQSGITATGTISVRLSGGGIGALSGVSIASTTLRMVQSAAATGTFVASSYSAPNFRVDRTGLTLAQLTTTHFIGGSNADIPIVYTAIASTNWSLGTTWDQGAAPGAGSIAFIPTGINVTTDAANVCNTLSINSGGTLTSNIASLAIGGNLTNSGTIAVGGGTVNVTGTLTNSGTFTTTSGTTTVTGALGTGITNAAAGLFTISGGTVNVGITDNSFCNRTFSNNGTLTVSSGTLNLYGNLNCPTGSKLNQSSGDINVDGNAGGVAANSVPDATPLVFLLPTALTDINFTGGTFTIVDPHANATLNSSFSLNIAVTGTVAASSTHTFRFGNGTSADAGGNAGGFNYNPWAGTGGMRWGNVEINGPAGTNRTVLLPATFAPVFATGNLTINSGGNLSQSNTAVTGAIAVGGNLVVNTGGTLTTSGLFLMGNAIYVTSTTISGVAATNAQTITNNGTINNLAVPTANFTNLQVWNSHASGVTFAPSFSPSLSGTLTVTDGTLTSTSLSFNGTSAVLTAATSFINVANVTLNNTVTLSGLGRLNLSGTLNFGNVNSKILTTAGLLTLKSTATGTARVADINNGIQNTGNTISGNVTIERFIPARRAWRLLTAPVTAASAPTINAAWQEGQTSTLVPASPSNTNPGFGTHITGGVTTLGFDETGPNPSSIKQYAGSSTWSSVANTNGTGGTKITDQPGYMLFVRGSRANILSSGASAVADNTTLRITGQLKTGTQSITVAAPGAPPSFQLIGNPYASAIDMHAIALANGGVGGAIKDNFILWDPKRGGAGTNGVGGFVTLSWNAGNNNYDYSTTPVSPLTQYIQSGSAFFVEANAAGTLTIIESNKTAQGSDNVNIVGGIDERVRVEMRSVTADASNPVVDGVLTTYFAGNSNAIDRNDAGKLANFSTENLSIIRTGMELSIERRDIINLSDTIFLKMANMKQQAYQFDMPTQALNHPGLTGYLVDSYTATSTVLNLDGNNLYNFTVNGDAASSGTRFMIVFAKAGPLPVTTTTVKAVQQGSAVAVEWKASNQYNMKQYEVEKSTDGINYTKVNMQPAIGANGSDATYNWLDVNAVLGNNYYRIRSIGISGEVKISQFVIVFMGKGNAGITVYPNPVINRNIGLLFSDMEKGIYQLRLLNTTGQVVFTRTVNHTGGSATQSVGLGYGIAKGSYQLEITKPDQSKTTKAIIITE